MIPLCVPEIRGNEWKYIKECLDGNWVSSVGAFVNRFEEDIARFVGVPHAVATVNGTSALHVALLLAGVRPDDEVLVPSLTFIAPANAIRYAGARPVFMDVDPVYWQMDPEKTAEFLTKECTVKGGSLVNKATGRRVSALLPVHALGHPVDLDPLIEAARRFGLKVIEDATESLGARYKDKPVGSLGDMACFSFNGNKLITTGGGGMLVTRDEIWAKKAKYLTTQAKDDPIEYLHKEIGYNYRLTNIQAAMGVAQMEQIDDYVAAKRRIAARYAERLGNVRGISCMSEAPWAFSVYWMYCISVDEKEYGTDSRSLLRKFQEAKIETRPLWQPLHRSPAHEGAQAYRIEVADRLYHRVLSLPCSVGLKAEDQDRVCEVIHES